MTDFFVTSLGVAVWNFGREGPLYDTDSIYGSDPSYKHCWLCGDPSKYEEAISTVLEDEKRQLAQMFASNLAKVRLGELGQVNGKSERVRNLGRLLVESHIALNQKAMQLAYKLRMMPPIEVETEAKQVCERVSKLNNEHFDDEFVLAVIADHEKSLKRRLEEEFDYYPPLLSETILVLRKQLAIAQLITEGEGCEDQLPH